MEGSEWENGQLQGEATRGANGSPSHLGCPDGIQHWRKDENGVRA
jgi:hypothetical protein